MKKIIGKQLPVLLVFVLVFIALAACSGKKDSGSQETGTPAASTKESVQASGNGNGPANGKYDPPIDLTALAQTGTQAFMKGDSINNGPHTRWALEKFGIKINYVIQPPDNEQLNQKLQLMMASGEKLPDIVNIPGGDPVMVAQLIDSGQFMPVDELYKKYAGPIYKDYSEKHPEIWYPYMKDGVKYGIPILEYAHNGDTVLWLREDWMKKLNLSSPKTLDDLEHIMDQFKNHNPDGLKPSEVFPLAITLKGSTNTWMGMLDWFFGMYGTVEEQWNLKEDGTLEYGSVNPGAKQALAKLNEWMKKGYIHKDAALWDEAKSGDIFTQGHAGILPAPNWAPDWPLPITNDNVKHAEFKAYPLPVGPDGKAGGAASEATASVVLIHKDFKHPEAFWTYYNYLLDHLADPKPGNEYEYGFAKGYDWDIVDGNPTNDRKKIGNNNVEFNFNFLVGTSNTPYRIPDQYFAALIKLADGGKAETPYEKQVQSYRRPENWYAAKVVLSQPDIRKPNRFIGAPTPTMKSRWDILKQSELETFTKIIYGKAPIDDFDKFVEKWYQNGGKEITKEVNDWYKSVSGK